MTAMPDAVHDDGGLRWNILQYRLQEIRTGQAVALFREHGIEPIVIKGVAAARYYPPDIPRVSIDVDLAVGEDCFAAASRICTSDEAAGLAIDLHRGLRHLDSLPWNDLMSNSVEIPLSTGDRVRVLRPEDDLRVLAVHWLTDGGSNKERLWDIAYAIDRRDDAFSWPRLMDSVSPTRRRWVECAIGAAAKYLRVDLSATPFNGADLRLPGWFTKSLESEWAAEIKARPLEITLSDRKMLLAQIKRRMRPNPIWATVDCEGSFDARTRIFYQIRNAVRRIPSSYRRVSGTLRRTW